MKYPLQIVLAVLAVALVPLSLHLALERFDGNVAPDIAIWAPLSVLALDALLFYFAFGIGNATVLERVGMALVLPLMLTMISWALMRDAIEARVQAAQVAQAALAAPSASEQATAGGDAVQIVGNDRDAHGCIGSAGYVWCAKEQACVRPWELTAAKGLPNLESAVTGYCGK
jgi:hypothetical protein